MVCCAVICNSGMYCGLKDGGVVDRIGLAAWRQRRRQQQQLGRRSSRLPPCLVHIIERSSPFSGTDDPEAAGESSIHVVRCPKSGVNFFDLGDFDRQFKDARERAQITLEGYQDTLSALPQLAGTQQQQQLVINNVVPTKGVSGVVLKGSSLGTSSSSNGALAGVSSGLVVAAASSSAGSSTSTGAAASPAGLASPRGAPAAARGSVRRAVQDDSNC